MSDLSIYIKQLRNQNHMRQTDFGKIVGVSGKAVWTWENNRSQPSFEQLCVLADHFGLDIDYFIHVALSDTAIDFIRIAYRRSIRPEPFRP